MATETAAHEQATTQTSGATSDPADRLKVTRALEEVQRRILSRPVPRVDEYDRDHERKMIGRIADRWYRLVREMGERYAAASLENFRISADGEVAKRQQAALEAIQALVENLADHVRSGGNVILYGPPGTGKDHLMAAALRSVVEEDFTVAWHNGQDLFGAFRDNIEKSESESSVIGNLADRDVLAISDPVPPKGEVRDFGAGMLYRAIDRRYRKMRGTWVTVNVLGKREAAEMLTGPIFDRLLDNCLTIECNWPSYREKRKPAWLSK